MAPQTTEMPRRAPLPHPACLGPSSAPGTLFFPWQLGGWLHCLDNLRSETNAHSYASKMQAGKKAMKRLKSLINWVRPELKTSDLRAGGGGVDR